MNTTEERQGWTSASNALADSLCPGRHLAQAKIPKAKIPEISPDAETGTRIHAALSGMEVQLTNEEQETVEAAKEIEHGLFKEVFNGNVVPACFREQRFWFKVPGTIYRHSAKPDVVFVARKLTLILEYKSLFGDVPESSSNLQLRDQAVLVAEHVQPYPTETLVAVIQPRITHKPQLCRYDSEALEQAKLQLIARVLASNNPYSPRIPGEVQCRHCRARNVCPERVAMAGALVKLDPTLPLSQWSPDDKAFFLDRAPIAQRWLDETKEALKTQLTADPEAIPGWTLKPGSVRENIVNPEVAFGRFSELGGELKAFMRCVSVGKTPLKDEIRTVTGEKGRALDDTLRKLCDGITERKQNAPSLARKE